LRIVELDSLRSIDGQLLLPEWRVNRYSGP
jgi:hypothetical protein